MYQNYTIDQATDLFKKNKIGFQSLIKDDLVEKPISDDIKINTNNFRKLLIQFMIKENYRLYTLSNFLRTNIEVLIDVIENNSTPIEDTINRFKRLIDIYSNIYDITTSEYLNKLANIDEYFYQIDEDIDDYKFKQMNQQMIGGGVHIFYEHNSKMTPEILKTLKAVYISLSDDKEAEFF